MKSDNIDEEKRLMYVAITRAEKYCIFLLLNSTMGKSLRKAILFAFMFRLITIYSTEKEE